MSKEGRIDFKSLLPSLTERFMEDLSLLPFFAAEIEFYLTDTPENFDHKNFLIALIGTCNEKEIPLEGVETEKGNNQLELKIYPQETPQILAENIIQLKKLATSIANKFGYNANFSSKPFSDEPGSGMHINLSLHNPDGSNVFEKARGVEEETDTMYQALAGLITTMPESMHYFAPTDDCYKRFDPMSPHIPTTISWGGNNRTTALRIPASTAFTERRHIEHRVPSCESDPFAVLTVILAGVYYGITHQLTAPMKIYGNASLEIYKQPPYNLVPLPKSLEQANEWAQEGVLLQEILEVRG